ncbi:MAG: penicillin-binding protein 2 [Alphaproteobacteria bacterium]|nr:penicillin-binding protein 2 [Alphaproteobacteria bacterium]
MNSRDNDRQRFFTRRAALLAGGQFGLLAALVGRMYYLQVVESDRYHTLAEENRINMRLLPPSRGRILDRFGVPIAVNQKNYRVLIKSENTPDVPAVLDRLAMIIDLGPEEKARILKEVRRKKKFVPVTVREFLEWEDVARLEVNAPDLPGVTIDVGERRFYPNSDSAAHILGYVGAPRPEDLTGDPLLELPGFRIGRSGIERAFDRPLRGAAGARQLEVNAVGRVIRELDRQDGKPGRDVVLTLDMALQRAATERLGEEAGAVVVMDAHTGALIVQASTPSFDPNQFTEGLSNAQWRRLADNERAPLRNKAIAGEYAPGSTFKMIVALAALEEGLITPQTSFFCPGHLELGDGKFHCWKRHGHGHVDLNRSLAESCDVYYYEVARKVGIDKIAKMAARFGLGTELGLDVPGERAGLIPTKAWKRAVVGQPWVVGETLVAGIGQGFVLTTPLQLATMTARMVNGGKAVTPYLARDRVERGQLAARADTPVADIGVDSGHLDLMIEAMNLVTQDRTGTAHRARITVPGLTMGGKTGTAQVRRISRREREAGVRKNEELPWRFRDHALFVGYGPIENPRYAIAVVVEHGGGGSSVAAPIARDVMAATLDRDPARLSPGANVAGFDGPGNRGS